MRGVAAGSRNPIAETPMAPCRFSTLSAAASSRGTAVALAHLQPANSNNAWPYFAQSVSAREGAQEVVMGFQDRLRQFARNTEGQDLLEYALLVGLIALVAVVAITSAGSSVNTIFTNIAADLAKAA